MAQGRLAHQPRAMGHQLAERDRRVERVPRRELGQDAGHRCVEFDPPLLDKLHQGQVGEQLRDRTDPVDRLGARRDLPAPIRESEAPGPDDLLVVDQCDRNRGQALRLHHAGDPALQRPGNLAVQRAGPDDRRLGGARRPDVEAEQHEQSTRRHPPGPWSDYRSGCISARARAPDPPHPPFARGGGCAWAWRPSYPPPCKGGVGGGEPI